MRRMVLALVVAGMVWIPSSAHANTCFWSIPGLDTYAHYDQVFTGRVLENKPPYRTPLFFVETVLKGRKIQAGTTIELRFNGWYPPLLVEGDRYTIPAHGKWVPHEGQKIYTDVCAQLTDPIVNPAAYGLSVVDPVFPPSLILRHRG